MAKVNFEIADFVSIDWQFSMTEARRIIDKKVGLQGNLDPRLFSIKNQSIIEAELNKFLPFGKENQNWIFNTGHGLSPDNSKENVQFVIDWIKKTNWNRD